MQLTDDVESARVLASEESFFSALLQADDQTLGAALTEDFRIVDVMAGQIATRGELLDAIKSGSVKFVDVTRFPGRAFRPASPRDCRCGWQDRDDDGVSGQRGDRDESLHPCLCPRGWIVAAAVRTGNQDRRLGHSLEQLTTEA